jgi:phosphatidylinositol alpha-1,6-mannosyltransferase
VKHLLVTNDFPPKLGGIQSYLWELWRRLPAEDVTVLCLDHPGAPTWDAAQDFRVERWPGRWMLPTPALRRRVEDLAAEVGAELVLLDPVAPLGALGLQLDRPWGVVVHGAELVVSANTVGYQLLVRRVLREARVVVAAGGYPAAAARRAAGRPVPTVVVPPGVDPERFRVLDAEARRAARTGFGLPEDGPLIVSVSRLVPRKGMDVLVQASAHLADRHPGLTLAVAGTGRDEARLRKLAGTLGAPVRFLGSVPDASLPDVYGCGDVFAMLCRDRWFGLEQEGFGIVFLEAAACGVPQVAGRSGGSAEAVEDGVTGLVVDDPRSVEDVVEAIDRLLADRALRDRLGAAARHRAVDRYGYDGLATELRRGLDAVDVTPGALGDAAPTSGGSIGWGDQGSGSTPSGRW